MLTDDIEHLLCCPVCQGKLRGRFERTCSLCGQIYPVQNGVLDLLPKALLARYADRAEVWQSKLALHERWWKEERNRPRKSARKTKLWQPSPSLLDNYLRLRMGGVRRKRLLDIGCGVGERAKHFPQDIYVGLDPLVLNSSYMFAFFRGIAEFLPFADQSFDVAIAVEVLDHVIDPKRVLEEALRVLAPGGALFLFVGLSSEGEAAVRKADRQTWYATSEDDVHLHSFRGGFFEAVLREFFGSVEAEHPSGYMAVWGWDRK